MGNGLSKFLLIMAVRNARNIQDVYEENCALFGDNLVSNFKPFDARSILPRYSSLVPPAYVRAVSI